MTEDILIKNGHVIDGTGSKPFKADILVKDGKIYDIGNIENERDVKTIDATNLVVAPGFIDVHSHLDFFIPIPRHAEVLETWIEQGATTIVAGNCGYSPAPVNHDFEEFISTYWNFALPKDGLEFKWDTMSNYLKYLEDIGQALNVAILTGHNTLRLNVMGLEARFANDDEIEEMKKMLRQSLLDGSIGLSLGLGYVPGLYSHTTELIELAKVLKEFNAPLVPHTRGLLTKTYNKAVEEVIHVAETVGIPLQISHHAGGGIGRSRKLAIKAINEALERGVKIGHDNIPWANASTTILSLFPPIYFDGGLDNFFKRLKNPETRQKIKQTMMTASPKWPPWDHEFITESRFSENLLIYGFRKEENKKFNFKTIKEVAKLLNKEPIDALIDVTIEERGKLILISGQFEYNEMVENFVAGLFHDPNCSVGSDVVGIDLNTIHPHAYGTFTKILGNYARDRNEFPLEEAVRKMTSLPARQMQLKDRGVLKVGAHADIAIFDPKTIKCNATFLNPRQRSTGVHHVIINGKLVYENRHYDPKILPGKIIRRINK